MIKSLWVKVLAVLIAVTAMGLISTFALRGLLVRDFDKYLRAETEDRAMRIIAALEASFITRSWDFDALATTAAWAYMGGVRIRLYDTRGNLRMDTNAAMDSLDEFERRRVAAVARQWVEEDSTDYFPYTLHVGGLEVGRMDASFARPRTGEAFVERSNRWLRGSMLALGVAALALSLAFARAIARPVHMLTVAASRIAEGELKSRVPVTSSDEIGQLSEAFNRMAGALEMQESLRKKLTANIAHELRTPLGAVRGELEGMIDGLIPMDRSHLQSLAEELARLRRILEGVEELAATEASTMTLLRQRLDLGEFLGYIVERYAPMFKERGVTLALDAARRAAVTADPDKLSQIVVNLLTNALKATGEGGSVTVRAWASGGVSYISVEDTGCGISKEDAPLVFERFYRASPGGLGIGLSIVKELASAHGGRVRLESTEGLGSSFIVEIPTT